MSIAERHKYIIDVLHRTGFIRIADIAKELGVTKVTVRKDVRALENDGILCRVHGSARLADSRADEEPAERVDCRYVLKRAIARLAARLPAADDSIVAGAGSTLLAFGEELRLRSWQRLNVVTSSLRLALLLGETEHVCVVQLGGEVAGPMLSVRGEEAARMLEECSCSTAFIGAFGIDPVQGVVTSESIEEAKLLRRMMRAATRTVVLADSSKFGRGGFGRICALSEVDTIVTDGEIPAPVARAVEEAGVRLLVAK